MNIFFNDNFANGIGTSWTSVDLGVVWANAPDGSPSAHCTITEPNTPAYLTKSVTSATGKFHMLTELILSRVPTGNDRFEIFNNNYNGEGRVFLVPDGINVDIWGLTGSAPFAWQAGVKYKIEFGLLRNVNGYAQIYVNGVSVLSITGSIPASTLLNCRTGMRQSGGGAIPADLYVTGAIIADDYIGTNIPICADGYHYDANTGSCVVNPSAGTPTIMAGGMWKTALSVGTENHYWGQLGDGTVGLAGKTIWLNIDDVTQPQGSVRPFNPPQYAYPVITNTDGGFDMCWYMDVAGYFKVTAEFLGDATYAPCKGPATFVNVGNVQPPDTYEPPAPNTPAYITGGVWKTVVNQKADYLNGRGASAYWQQRIA